VLLRVQGWVCSEACEGRNTMVECIMRREYAKGVQGKRDTEVLKLR